MSYSLIAGDLEPDMELTVDAEGTPLVGALAVNMRWKRPDGTVTLVPLAVVDAPAGKVKRVWEAGDSDQTGVHRGRIVVTHANNEPQTFPQDGSWFIWNVYSAT